jgi:hypothetical protein
MSIETLVAACCAMLGSLADDPVSFKRDVAPLVVRKCLSCHNDQKAESGLNLKTFSLLRKGGKAYGDGILEPSNPEASALLEVVLPDAAPRMPYKLPALSDAEIDILRRWIAEGATFDAESEAQTLLSSLVDPLDGLPNVVPTQAVSDPVAAMAFARDSHWLAAAVGNAVEVTSLDGGFETFVLEGHPGAINALLVTPDGKAIVACGGRPGMFGAISVWDVATKKRRIELRGHTDAILAADLAQDGRTLATSSYDRLIKLWDLDSGVELSTLKEHTDAVYSVCFSPDGGLLASAGGDRTVKVWRPATGERLLSLSDATAEQYAVCFGASSEVLYAGGVDRVIRGWHIEGKEATLFTSSFAHDAAILELVFDKRSQRLLSASEDRSIKSWPIPALESGELLAKTSEWPLSVELDPNGDQLAVGLYDGALVLLAAKSGELVRQVRNAPVRHEARRVAAAAQEPAPTPAAKKVELLRYATLAPPNPRGGLRGTRVRVSLSGHGVGSAQAIAFASPGVSARLIPKDPADANNIDAEFEIAADARLGVHTFQLRTALGTTPPVTFAVANDAEVAEAEPNNTVANANPIQLPVTLLGTVDRPGEVDVFQFDVREGELLVIECLARPLGSGLSCRLVLRDAAGVEVARATRGDDGREALLIHTPNQSGRWTLEVSDTDMGGSGNHFYRLAINGLPFATSVFPLSVVAGAESEVRFRGSQLAGERKLAAVDAQAQPGSIVPLAGLDLPRSVGLARVVAAGTVALESEPNHEIAVAQLLDSPGGISGTIESPDDNDLYGIDAKKGERLVFEVFARRLGSALDPVIEILDEEGQPLPRAVARPIRQTLVAFRDHPSTGRNIRLTYPWTGFKQGDYVLIGREVSRIAELPRNLDDDAVFWGLGNARNNTGDRVGLLGTTPEHHPQNQPIYQVELHPPGSTFASGGIAPLTVYYRNDDGGPGFGKDSMLEFESPRDGRFHIRVADVRGLGGPDFGYHLVTRRAQPDFELSLATNSPNIPRNSSVVIPVNVRRIDGFMGPIDVTVENLPAGITATSVRVEPEQYTAELLFSADTQAAPFPASSWAITGRAQLNSGGSDPRTLVHSIEVGKLAGGWITVVPEPNLKVTSVSDRVEIEPGRETTLSLTIERRNGFAGRVPIEIRNLPFGVRVLNVGLNGVLVTEQQTERTITLYAEPWVAAQEHPFYAVALCEPAGTNDSSPAISLIVRPEVSSSAER